MARRQRREYVSAQMTSEPTKPEPTKTPKLRPANGTRTAVKYGHTTAEEALLGFAILRQGGTYVQPSITNWLMRRCESRAGHADI